MADTRVIRPGRQPYNTRSHKYRPVRTPGGRLVAQKIVKKSTGPKCSDCKCSLPGIRHLKATAYRKLKKRQKTVSRPYGGATCGKCVKERIIRAFLIEEQMVVKKLLKERKP